MLKKISRNIDLALTFGFFGIIVLLVLPIPTRLLDILLALSIGVAILILLVIVYLKEPSEFSVFPVILLAITLFRLGLNVASTRLILLDGFAGDVIQSFGAFVVRGNYVVGAVIFLILVVINFVVITKGAGRIAEVAARFTLDSLPGKQMSIDAELNAGLIDESVATYKRNKLQQEADFYGAMDGASKFVRGDAIAGILITLINIVGGISIGVLDKGLSLAESLQKFTLLSIGDGLVSQIPALIISIGAGILITRTSEGVDLGGHLGKQLRIYPRAVGVCSAMLGIFGLLPGMPFFPFFILALACGALALFLKKNQSLWGEDLSAASGEKRVSSKQSEQGLLTDGESLQENQVRHHFSDIEKMVQVELFCVELGFGLIGMADKTQNGDLLDRIKGIRQQFARDYGIILPAISVKDNIDLAPNEYRFLLRGNELEKGTLHPNRWLAVNVSHSDFKPEGQATKEPVFGLDAVWISQALRDEAESNGYTTVDASSVLITHLTEIIREKAYLMLEREDVQKLIDIIKVKNPTLINELIPEQVSVGLLQKVLQNLLQEHISIKNLSLIIETIGDFVGFTKNPDDLSEQVRKRLSMYFISNYQNSEGVIEGIALDPKVEHFLLSRIKRTQFDIGLLMDPEMTQALIQGIKPYLAELIEAGKEPVVITISELRLAFKRFFEPTFPKMSVLSYQELPPNAQLQTVGVVCVPETVFQRISSKQYPLNTEKLAPV